MNIHIPYRFFNQYIYTQVVDNRRIIKGFFWSIIDHYLKDGSLDDDMSNKILGGNSKWYIIAIICYLKNKYTSKWYIIAIICYLKNKYTSCKNVFFEIILL